MMTDCRLRTVSKHLLGVIFVTLLSGFGVIDSAWAAQSINNASAEVPAETNRDLAIVRSRTVNVNYYIAPQSRADIDRIELWYALGQDGPWMFYGYDQDRIAPVRFIAPSEGVYRFIVVAIDRWGRSSCGSGKRTTPDDPGFIPSGTPAQQTVFIDYTAPELYLRNPQTNGLNNQVEINWMGFDPYLGDYPVRLFWQMSDGHNRDLSGQQWNPIGADHLATGQFFWQVPADVTGQVIIKAVLTDQAGNQDTKYSSPVLVKAVAQESPQPQVKELPQPEPVTATSVVAAPVVAVPVATTPVAAAPVVAVAPVAEEPQLPKITAMPEPLPEPCVAVAAAAAEPLAKTLDEPNLTPSAEAAAIPDNTQTDQDVERCFRSGSLHSRRGEWAQARQAYTQALELEPHHIPARVNLADVLCKLGEFSQAKQQYERCLQIKPNHKQALFGLAQVQIAMTQFRQARQTRDKLLKLEDQGWQSMLDQPEKPHQPMTAAGGS